MPENILVEGSWDTLGVWNTLVGRFITYFSGSVTWSVWYTYSYKHDPIPVSHLTYRHDPQPVSQGSLFPDLK
jgi:hypothetical protein